MASATSAAARIKKVSGRQSRKAATVVTRKIREANPVSVRNRCSASVSSNSRSATSVASSPPIAQ